MIFLDSSDPKEIKDITAWGVLSGITTNPLIIAKEGGNVDLETRIKEVIEVSRGDVSVELTTETEKAMLEEAAKYHAWNPKRICIKVPFGEIGPARAALARHARRAHQRHLHDVVQPGLSRGARRRDVRQHLRGPRPRHGLRRAAHHPRDAQHPRPREAREQNHRRLDPPHDGRQRRLAGGAHIITVPPAILRKMLWNPRTDETIREFNTAWANRGKK